MENEKEKEAAVRADTFFKITAVEAVTVAVIIAAVLFLKNFMPEKYGKVKDFYESRFTDETDTDGLFGDADEV